MSGLEGAVEACLPCEEGGYVVMLPGGAWGESSRRYAIGEPVRLVWGMAVSLTPRETFAEVLAEVATKRGAQIKDIVGQSRRAPIVRVRQEVMWEARQRTSLSLPAIGRKLGGRDHSTVLHGIRRHAARMAEAGA